MSEELMLALVKHLYEGRCACPPSLVSDSMTFRDPLVLVDGREPVEAMFLKLNKLFPTTEVKSFSANSDTSHPCSWCMTVDYKRSHSGSARTMRSILEVDYHEGEVSRLTEHWLSPVNLRGDKPNRLGKLLRKSLGHLIGR